MYRTTNLPNTRIEVADALRGIAVAGIILFHALPSAVKATQGICGEWIVFHHRFLIPFCRLTVILFYTITERI